MSHLFTHLFIHSLTYLLSIYYVSDTRDTEMNQIIRFLLSWNFTLGKEACKIEAFADYEMC